MQKKEHPRNSDAKSESNRIPNDSRKDHKKIGIELLKTKLEESGIHLPQEGLRKLWKFHQYLRDQNEELNLTRIHNFESMVRKHYVDSLIVLNILKARRIPIPFPLMDIGTGAGFPGVPIAIAMPSDAVILAEGRKRRVEYLHRVVELLALNNCSVYGKRIYADSEIHAQTVITRAVEQMPLTVERVRGVLKSNGLIIFMKGPDCESEKETLLANPSLTLILDESYELPASNDKRRLLVWRYQPTDNQTDESITYMKSMQNAIEISSEQNVKYKLLRSLLHSRGIKKESLALLSGTKIISEFLKNHFEHASALIVLREQTLRTREKTSGFFSNVINPQIKSLPIWSVPDHLFNELDISGTGTPLLLVAVKEIPLWDVEIPIKGCTLLLPFGNPENLGAALRSAAAFGVSQVVLLKEAAHPYHPKAIRAASGESFHLKLTQGPSLSELNGLTLKTPLYVLDAKGESILNHQPPESFLLLAGEEGKGIPDIDNALVISIPISSDVESLNATVAVSIALFSMCNKK